MYPLLEQSKNPDLFVYAADYSKTAVDVVLGNRKYDPTRSSAFVWDLSSSEIPKEIEPESLDMIVLIFVLSALAPEQWDQAVKNIHKVKHQIAAIRTNTDTLLDAQTRRACYVS